MTSHDASSDDMHDAMSDPQRDDTPVDEAVIRDAGAFLRQAMPPLSFDAGFTDRTMARLAASRVTATPALQRFSAMQRSFRLLAAAAAIAIVALGAHNTLIARVANTSIVEAALGLEPVSAESLLSATLDGYQ